MSVRFLLIVSSAYIPSAYSDSLCRVDCSRVSDHRPICGSNNKTYKNRCELQKELCTGNTEVTVRHRGPCQEGVLTHCLEERRTAARTSTQLGMPIFVPECNKDGSYVDVQCHTGTGYCWCVNESGKPVPGSSVRYARPRCRSADDASRYRRGRGRNRKRKKGSRNRKGCTQADRNGLVAGLKEMVSTEYRSLTRPEGTPIGSSDSEVMEWKFSQLDENRDGVLTRRELKTFKADVKKVLRPKRCSRSFLAYCDLDTDRRITKQEWRSCAGLEQNISFKLFHSLNSDEDEQRRREQRERKREQEAAREQETAVQHETPMQRNEDNADNSASSLHSRQFVADGSGRNGGLPAAGASTGGSIGGGWSSGGGAGQGVDCLRLKAEARAEARNGNEAAYVPECKPNGEYSPVQCYKSTGYCWCVEEGTGRPVPGTSTKHNKPDCNKPSRKEWVKCEGMKRDQFLAQIQDWLKDQMSRSRFRDPAYRDTRLGMSERSMMWKFSVLDRNKDGVLKRKEMRVLKAELREVEGLKLCGKRINKYCDTNSDSIITVDEFTQCLRQDTGSRGGAINPATRRRGPNPLKTWLKGD